MPPRRGPQRQRADQQVRGRGPGPRRLPHLPSLNRAQLYDWECETVVGRTDQDVEFYVGVAREKGGPVLELGCGTGRVTTRLAEEAGVPVIGVDIDADMLSVARSRYAGPLVCGDMRRFSLGTQFPLVIIPFSSLQELDVTGRRACLALIGHHLAPDGVLALEVTELPIADLATVDMEPIAEGEIDGRPVRLSAGLVVDETTVTYQRRFDVDGETISADVTLAVVAPAEIKAEADAAGIADVRFATMD